MVSQKLDRLKILNFIYEHNRLGAELRHEMDIAMGLDIILDFDYYLIIVMKP